MLHIYSIQYHLIQILTASQNSKNKYMNKKTHTADDVIWNNKDKWCIMALMENSCYNLQLNHFFSEMKTKEEFPSQEKDTITTWMKVTNSLSVNFLWCFSKWKWKMLSWKPFTRNTWTENCVLPEFVLAVLLVASVPAIIMQDKNVILSPHRWFLLLGSSVSDSILHVLTKCCLLSSLHLYCVTQNPGEIKNKTKHK